MTDKYAARARQASALAWFGACQWKDACSSSLSGPLQQSIAPRVTSIPLPEPHPHTVGSVPLLSASPTTPWTYTVPAATLRRYTAHTRGTGAFCADGRRHARRLRLDAPPSAFLGIPTPPPYPPVVSASPSTAKGKTFTATTRHRSGIAAAPHPHLHTAYPAFAPAGPVLNSLYG